MIHIDRNTLTARAWAIAAISGLMVLHHDFNTPRLARVHRLCWHRSSVDVYLQYGLCNLSGQVIDATELVVTLHQGGAVGIRHLAAAAPADLALLTFLAGEVYREALRWAEHLQAWQQREMVDGDRAAILAIVSALLAHPSIEMQVEIVKQAYRGASVAKARLLSATSIIDITPAGFHGVNLYIHSTGNQPRRLRLQQEVDMRLPTAEVDTPGAHFLKGTAFSARQLIRLPIGALACWRQKRPPPAVIAAPDVAAYQTACMIDAHGGDSLSALSN